MSTFTYDTASPVLRDSAVIQNFRSAVPDEYLTRLNLQLGTSLTARDFLRIQVYFANTALRDPTAGELRLLDAVCQRNSYAPHRIAVGELITESPALAKTWADMMAKHSALNGTSVTSRAKKNQMPPCSLTDALNLTGRYLYREGLRREEDSLVLSSIRQEAVAVAEGYTPVARALVGGSTRSFWTRKGGPLSETPCRAGDLLLYLPRLSLRQARELVAAEADKRVPTFGAIRALTETSLLATALELCPAVDFHASRLPGSGDAGALIPFAVLCGRPSVTADGACGYLLRVPLRRMTDMTLILKEQNLPFIACGQARTEGNLTILLPDVSGAGEYAAVSLPPELIRDMNRAKLCAMRSEALDIPFPKAACPPLACLPSAAQESDGMTPEGREIVALTAQAGDVLAIPEAGVRVTAKAVDIPVPSTAYSAAAEAAASAALTLEQAGLSPDAVRLSVSLSVSNHDMLTDGPALSAIGGVYCAAAQLGIPVEDSVITTAPAPIPMSLTVTAWAKAPLSPSPDEDHQWRPSVKEVHKESPAYILPVLRRVCEGSLQALSAALNRNRGAACALSPLAVQSVTDEESGESRFALHPDSLKKLLMELDRVTIPVIALNSEDTRLLLAPPEVRDALRRRGECGWPTLVLGESCAVFAEYGLLPAPLARTRVLPAGGFTAGGFTAGGFTAGVLVPVAYTFSAETVTRLLRADPLIPADPAAAMAERHLLELRLPDGTIIPDGFISSDGQILGLLNGLDTTILPRVEKCPFDLA